MANPRVDELAKLAGRNRKLRRTWGEQLRDLAKLIDSMGRALIEDDDILGALAGEGIANHLPALPQHIREEFTEHLSDEAARGFHADRLYMEAQAR